MAQGLKEGVNAVPHLGLGVVPGVHQVRLQQEGGDVFSGQVLPVVGDGARYGPAALDGVEDYPVYLVVLHNILNLSQAVEDVQGGAGQVEEEEGVSQGLEGTGDIIAEVRLHQHIHIGGVDEDTAPLLEQLGEIPQIGPAG